MCILKVPPPTKMDRFKDSEMEKTKRYKRMLSLKIMQSEITKLLPIAHNHASANRTRMHRFHNNHGIENDNIRKLNEIA